MSSFRRANADAQTAFRKAALANGYSPIPNVDKRTFYPNWPDVSITDSAIDRWAGSLAYQATGLRVENGLCAIDVDINDADLVDALWKRAVAAYPQLQEALIRYGSGDKEAWFCRTDEEFSVIFSTTHVRPGEDPEAKKVQGHRLEAFGGGHARQMGAFGAHTMLADNSDFLVEYQWADDLSPADVILDSLPIMPKEAVLHLAEMASELLEKAEWPRVLRSRCGESDCGNVYDLTTDMTFHCLDNHTRRLDELAEYAKTSNNARCSASWMGDSTAVNLTRCLISVDHHGSPSVLETANWTRHLPMADADRDRPTSDKVTDLVTKMREKGFDFDHETFFDADDAFQRATMDLGNNWAWCGSRSVPCLPIYRDEEHGMALANLRTTYTRYSYTRVGPRGGETRINPVDAWVSAHGREDVDGYRFMPHKPQGIHEFDGIRAINSYCAPQHVQVPDEGTFAFMAELWEDFLVHLLPNAEEREWFMDFLAHKKQNLTVPGVAVIMVARTFGVGRGSLFEIIENVFGQKYVNSVTADNLMGIGNQGTYTDWMANALFVTADEVLPEGDDGAATTWRRRKAYERLKERVDPKPRRMHIVRKTLPNYHDMVYATFILATQHENALPIPRGDRRFVVLTNNVSKMAANVNLMSRLNKVRPATSEHMDPVFIASVAQWLDSRDVSAFNAHVAPDFSGKETMFEANISELDDLVADVLEGMPHDWCTMDAALDRIERSLIQRDLKDSFPKWRAVCSDIIKQQWYFVGRAYIDDSRAKKGRVVVRTPATVAIFRNLTPAEKGEQFREMSKLDSKPTSKLAALRRGISEV